MGGLGAAGEAAKRKECLTAQHVGVFPGRNSHEKGVALDVDHRSSDGGGHVVGNLAPLFGGVDQFTILLARCFA